MASAIHFYIIWCAGGVADSSVILELLNTDVHSPKSSVRNKGDHLEQLADTEA